MIDLARNEEHDEAGDSGVVVVIQVLSGSVELMCGDVTIRCEDGPLDALKLGEAQSLRAREQSRMLLTFSQLSPPHDKRHASHCVARRPMAFEHSADVISPSRPESSLCSSLQPR